MKGSMPCHQQRGVLYADTPNNFLCGATPHAGMLPNSVVGTMCVTRTIVRVSPMKIQANSTGVNMTRVVSPCWLALQVLSRENMMWVMAKNQQPCRTQTIGIKAVSTPALDHDCPMFRGAINMTRTHCAIWLVHGMHAGCIFIRTLLPCMPCIA